MSLLSDILYACFGFTFVTATAKILAGAVLERGRLWPSMLFLLCWTTFVYYVLAYFEWNPNGWLYKLGVYDFAGSGPVHIASGFLALAWALVLGKRRDPNKESLHDKVPHFRIHSPFLVGLGTILIWFGWHAFNGASTANISLRSISVVVNTNLAACGGSVAWALLEYGFHRKLSISKSCSGIISGLVGIAPAAGYIPVYVDTLVGVLTSCCSYFTVRYKYLLGVNEGLDIFAIYGVGGLVGDVLTGFFAASFVTALDGVNNAYEGGWWNHNWKQMGYQLAAACTCALWSFVISIILLFIIDKIPGLHIKATEEDELRELDFKYLRDVDAEGEIMILSGLGSVTPGMSGSASEQSREGITAPGIEKRS